MSKKQQKDTVEWQWVRADGTRVIFYEEGKMRAFIAAEFLVFAKSWDPSRTCELRVAIMRVEKRHEWPDGCLP